VSPAPDGLDAAALWRQLACDGEADSERISQRTPANDSVYLPQAVASRVSSDQQARPLSQRTLAVHRFVQHRQKLVNHSGATLAQYQVGVRLVYWQAGSGSWLPVQGAGRSGMIHPTPTTGRPTAAGESVAQGRWQCVKRLVEHATDTSFALSVAHDTFEAWTHAPQLRRPCTPTCSSAVSTSCIGLSLPPLARQKTCCRQRDSAVRIHGTCTRTRLNGITPTFFNTLW